MENNIKVQILNTCPICAGKKILVDPFGFWQELRKNEIIHHTKTGKSWTNEEYDEYISSCGYDPKDLKRLPPEECECDECEGSGKTTRWITLDEFKALLS